MQAIARGDMNKNRRWYWGRFWRLVLIVACALSVGMERASGD